MSARANPGRLAASQSLTLVTYEGEPELTASDRLLAGELGRRGCAVRIAQWTDTEVDWKFSRCTVLRSPWDACKRPEEFLRWLTTVEQRSIVVNPPDLLRWNFDKRYLFELAARGVSIIATQYRERGAAIDDWITPWDEVVVKPVIGASSSGVRQFKLPQERPEMERHTRGLLSRTGVLLQRYEPSVRTASERSLVFIGGAYSHAVRRIAFNLGSTPDTDEFDHAASFDELRFAECVLGAANAECVPYARVDLLPTAHGLVLMELELIDPALFLTRRPMAAAELAEVLIRYIS